MSKIQEISAADEVPSNYAPFLAVGFEPFSIDIADPIGSDSLREATAEERLSVIAVYPEIIADAAIREYGSLDNAVDRLNATLTHKEVMTLAAALASAALDSVAGEAK